MTLGAASPAAVQDHLLPICSVECSDRRHQRFALASTIARMRAIDMPTVQADRTVIPMLASADGWPNKCAAMPALERLAAVRAALGFGCGAVDPLRSANPLNGERFASSPMLVVHLRHVEVLL